MRTSHVYQPVMSMTLLRGGECSTEEVARAILSHDQSQAEYYEAVTNNMVGRVLRSHGAVERDGLSRPCARRVMPGVMPLRGNQAIMRCP